MHLAGLEAMGASIRIEHGNVEARADRLLGADITFAFPSVGATENILTAAVLAKGTTTIDNAAREPEIADLCNMLVAMGAEIEGIGSSTLVIHGVEPGSLHPVTHAVVTDRVQAATYLAAGVCGGEVVLPSARPPTWRYCCAASTTWACRRDCGDGLAVFAGERPLRSIDVATLRTRASPPTTNADHDDAEHRRRRRHRHREPLPGPLPLRRGAATAGRRHPYRRTPRRGAAWPG
jgi:UDP-N-acetylglucosamine 1-carboxyvinyltransferase